MEYSLHKHYEIIYTAIEPSNLHRLPILPGKNIRGTIQDCVTTSSYNMLNMIALLLSSVLTLYDGNSEY